MPQTPTPQVVIPGPRRRGFFERQWVQNALLAVGAAIASAAGGFSFFARGEPLLAAGIFTALIISAFAWTAKGRSEKKKEDRQAEPPVDLSACVRTICAIVRGIKKLQTNDPWTVRATIHRPHPDKPGRLQQCIPYVGGDEDGMGRDFPDNCGVVGLAFAEKKSQVFKRKGSNYQAFVEELKSAYRYTEAEARMVRHDRWAAMAVPIFGIDPTQVIGVFYLDSDDKKFFTETVQNVIVYGSQGISRHVSHAREGASDG